MEINQFINTWSKDKWIAKKDLLKNCVWCEGALLEHEDEEYVYFAPFPTEIGALYELKQKDIVDCAETGRTIKKIDTEYREVRIYIKSDLVLVKIEWRLGRHIPDDIKRYQEVADGRSKLVAESAQTEKLTNLDTSYVSSIIDRRLRGAISRQSDPTDPNPGTDPPSGGGGNGDGGGSGGGGGGDGVSGVRG